MSNRNDKHRYAGAWLDRARFNFPVRGGVTVDGGVGLGRDALEPETELDFDSLPEAERDESK